MKLAEIIVGEFYEVSVNPHQVQGTWGDEDGILDHPRIVTRWLISDVKERSFRGIKAKAVGTERSETGRTLVRVECVAMKPRTKEYVEDNYDGTRTEWRGLVVDEDENPVEYELRFEALVVPHQVKRRWEDALVEREVRKANHILDHDRERYFGGES